MQYSGITYCKRIILSSVIFLPLKTYIQIVVQRLLREILEGSSSQGALPSPPAFTFLLITLPPPFWYRGVAVLLPGKVIRK
jgi:hypothetical protein